MFSNNLGGRHQKRVFKKSFSIANPPEPHYLSLKEKICLLQYKFVFENVNDTGKLLGVEPKTFLRLLVWDTPPLSYSKLVGAKAIKLGSWNKHPAYW